MKEKKALIVGNFYFPDGNAAGKRVLGLGYILEALGYKVFFAGCEINRETNSIEETQKQYDSFIYYTFNGARTTKDILDVNGCYSDFKRLLLYIGIDDVSLVIIYGSPVLALWVSKVQKFCKRHNIITVFDCVDWIEKSGFEGIVKNCIKYLDTNLMKRYYACKCDGVISISRYLFGYYTKKKKKTVIIPPVGKSCNSYNYSNRSDVIKLVYAGSMPKTKNIDKNSLKDRIDVTVELLYRLKKRGIRVVLYVYGIEKEQYLQAIPEHRKILEELGQMIQFYGRTSNNIVCESVKQADFTILNRIITKVTIAGFPTKVSESLLMGTPVITNDTSDMREYIKDYYNGIIIDFDLECAEKQLVKLLESRIIIDQMKRNCTSECIFEYNQYTDRFRDFMGEIVNQ